MTSQHRHAFLHAVTGGALLALAAGSIGCFKSSSTDGEQPDAAGEPDPTVTADDCTDTTLITYRDDLDAHPGCSTAGLAYTPAAIPGYKCAAKAYPVTT